MGLDMYIMRETLKPEPDKRSDEWEAWHADRELAYWRKHPDLHGFIIREFAGGVDECQEIPLTAADLRKILNATRNNALPHTEGFFFGASQPEDKADTREKISRILELLIKEPGTRIYYQASW